MKTLFQVLLLSLFGQLGAAGEVEVIYEVFSMPLKEAAKLRRERLGGGESYRRILKKLEKGEVKQESWMALKVLEDQTAILEEVDEFISPTEYEPPELPHMVGPTILNDPPPPFPLPVTPSAFDTRNTGETLELRLGKSGSKFSLSLAATKIGLMGLDEFGEKTGQVEMPRFAVQALKVGATIEPGKAALLGTVSPPRELQKNEKRVWLAFVTLVETKE